VGVVRAEMVVCCENYTQRRNKICGSVATRVNVAFSRYIERRKRKMCSVDVTDVNGEYLMLGVQMLRNNFS
jgi:hypothetical protein